jgi:hypothetical protein
MQWEEVQRLREEEMQLQQIRQQAWDELGREQDIREIEMQREQVRRQARHELDRERSLREKATKLAQKLDQLQLFLS